jgi:hypothetical protein
MFGTRLPNLVLAVLLAVAVLLSPLRAAMGSPCCCRDGCDTLSITKPATPAETTDLASLPACCRSKLEACTETAAESEPAQHQPTNSCDGSCDCPMSCCVMAKVVLTHGSLVAHALPSDAPALDLSVRDRSLTPGDFHFVLLRPPRS